MNNILHDISWVVPLRHELLTPLFEFFTWLGYPTFIFLLLPLGYWLWSKDKFTRVAVIVVVSAILNSFLKDLWENPRPDLIFRLDGGVGDSFGMPSGHAQVSAVLWFWIAYEVQKSWAWVVASIIVAGICFSRIYLGIHDLEDILAGLGIAVITLFLFRFCLSPRFESYREGSVYLHLVGIIVVGILVKVAWPPAENSITAIALFGMLVFWLLGRHLEERYVGFDPRQGIWNLTLVAIIGIVSVIGMSALLKAMSVGLDPLLAGTIRSSILSLSMTLFAPWLFSLCKLGRQS
jgi:glycerophosphoryl diester phosphodiesterase